MQDIESIRRYWESELELGGRHGESVPIVTSPVETTWIWLDLHLSDRGALEAFDRGFADVAAMNRNLLAAWRRRVRPGDMIICLGDVAHPDAWRDRRLVLDLRACPGRADPDPRQPRPEPRRAPGGGVHDAAPRRALRR